MWARRIVGRRTTQKCALTLWGLVIEYGVVEFSYHCFSYWLAAYSAPSQYLNQRWRTVSLGFVYKLHWYVDGKTTIMVQGNDTGITKALFVNFYHYCDVTMGAMASQITSLTMVYSIVHSGTDQRKHQSSASLAFVIGEFPAQMANNAENVSIWWRHHG